MRAPTIAWWSDRRIGKVERRPSSHMDLLPTLAHLAGANLPSHLVLDGVRPSTIQPSTFNLKVNIAPLILMDGNAGSVEDRPVYFYRGNLLYAIRMNSYKVPLPSCQRELISGVKIYIIRTLSEWGGARPNFLPIFGKIHPILAVFEVMSTWQLCRLFS